MVMVVSSVAFSQTAYELKCRQIVSKYWVKFTNGRQMSQEEKKESQNITSFWQAKNFMRIYIMNYTEVTGKSPDVLLKQMENDFNEAQKLLETPKSGDSQKMDNSYRDQWHFIHEFIAWCQKDEYEKNVDWETRLQKQVCEKFDDLAYSEIHNEAKEMTWRFQCGKYDADKECLEIIFCAEHHQIIHYLQCNPDKAKDLKKRFELSQYKKPKLYGSKDKVVLGLTTNSENSADRMEYYVNTMLYAGKYGYFPAYFIIITPEDEWTFDNRDLELTDITIQYDKLHLQDLGISPLVNKYMKGHVFYYNNYKNVTRQRQAIKDSLARREQEIRDSLAVIEKEKQDSIDFFVYTDMLDSLINDINTRLIKEKYNIFGFQVVNHETIDKKNPMISYQAAVTKLQTERNEQKKQLQSVHDAIFNQNKDIFGSSEIFDKYYCQGIDAFMDSLLFIVNNKLATNKYNINKLRVASRGTLDNHNNAQAFLTLVTEITTERKRISDQIMSERSKIWSQSKDVFNDNTNEFDKYYCQGMDYFNANIEYLRILKYVEDNKSRIATIDFKKRKFNSVLTGKYDTKKNFEDINSFSVNLVNMVYACDGSAYYDKIIDILITNNSSLLTEYTKNGSYFSSEAEFYEAFSSEDYKDILKSNKR